MNRESDASSVPSDRSGGQGSLRRPKGRPRAAEGNDGDSGRILREKSGRGLRGSRAARPIAPTPIGNNVLRNDS